MLMPIKGKIPYLGQKTRAESVLIFQRPQYSFSLGRILSLVVDCGLISEKVASWNVVFSVVGLQFRTSCSRIIVDLLDNINGLPILIQKIKTNLKNPTQYKKNTKNGDTLGPVELSF